MKTVQLQDAKARFSALVDDAIAGERVTVTRHGKPVAVIVSAEEWDRISEKAPSFADLLLSFPGSARDIPRRSRKPLREVDL
jgi:antitoxin Phd